MKTRVVSLPLWRSRSKSGLGVDLMDKHVAAVAVLYHRGTRSAVAGDHDCSARSLKSKTVSLSPGTVIDPESFDRHILISVNDARLEVVGDDFVSGFIGGLTSVETDINILSVGLQYVCG